MAEGIVIKPVKDVILEGKKGPKESPSLREKSRDLQKLKPRGRDRVANGYKKQAEGVYLGHLTVMVKILSC